MPLSIVIIKILPLWNVNFLDEVSAAYGTKIRSKEDLMYYRGTDLISNVVIAVIFAVIIIEMSVTIYKTLRYIKFRK